MSGSIGNLEDSTI